MGNLGGVRIENMNETLNQSVDVTAYPVEKGAAISAHIKNTSDTFVVTGYILSKPNQELRQANTQYNKLSKIMKSGKIITYSGRDKLTSCVIVSMSKDHSKAVKNGMSVTINLQQVRLVKSPVTKKKTTGKKSTSKNSGKKFVKVRKGDTYWAASMKYGTNLKKLMAFPENKWRARFIPIGVMMRVK